MDFLLECLRKGTAPVKVVEFAKKYLNELGFEELYYNTSFEPEEGGRYYMTPFPDVIFAFTMGQKRTYRQKLRMAFAHVDQPCFKVKASPDFENMGAAQLNVEVYGGMMDHTWFDRPLGLSGSVALVGEDPFHPCILSYESDGPVAVIPGLAIHMNREAANGWKIDRQKELMPVTGLAGGPWTRKTFTRFLAEELNVEEGEILAFDLNLYNCDPPQLVGFENELVLSPRIDNLASVSALLESLVEGERDSGINLIGLFNHEEVGSFSKSGADSDLLTSVLKTIFEALGAGEEDFRASISRSLYLSADGAHGAHPNYPDRCDPTTRALIGRGPAIKSSGTCKYVTDLKVQAILKGLAEKYDLPLQIIGDRNTIRGGTTLGPMVGSHLPMAGCDIGIPMWSMHSARETMAMCDYRSMCRLLTAFFKE